ncbi:MAG TPA: hypothetical protein VFM43_06475 [Gaiellaceae bacterium]|nr:hypothetical protein [Gaiellaceae bacterium]
MDEAQTFRPEVLGGYDSVKGFAVIGIDGRAGRVSWVSDAPGKSYLVVSTGLRRRHRVLPAGAVTSVSHGEVHVSLSREEIRRLPLLWNPQARRLLGRRSPTKAEPAAGAELKAARERALDDIIRQETERAQLEAYSGFSPPS